MSTNLCINDWAEYNENQHKWLDEFSSETDKKNKLLEYATSFHNILVDIKMTYTPTETKNCLEEMLSVLQTNIDKGSSKNQKEIIDKLITHINHKNETGDIKFKANVDRLEDKLENNVDRLEDKLETLLEYTKEIEKKSLIPINIGNSGEDIVKNTIESEFKDLIVEDTSGTGHKADLHVTGKGWPEPILVEVKNYSHVVPSKEVTKFWNDMEDCNAKYGVFISLCSRIAKQNRGIDIEKKNGRFGIFASECHENISNTIIACFRVIKSISDILIQESNLEESVLQNFFNKVQKWLLEFSNYSNKLDDSIKTYRNLQDKHRKLDKEWETQQLLELKETFSSLFRDFPKALTETNLENEMLVEPNFEELLNSSTEDANSSGEDANSSGEDTNSTGEDVNFINNFIVKNEEGILTTKDIFNFIKIKGFKIKYDRLKELINSNNINIIHKTSSSKLIKKYLQYHCLNENKKTLSNIINGYSFVTTSI